MLNVLYRIPIAINMANCLFQWKKSYHDVKLNWRSQYNHFWNNKYNHPEEYVM